MGGEPAKGFRRLPPRRSGSPSPTRMPALRGLQASPSRCVGVRALPPRFLERRRPAGEDRQGLHGTLKAGRLAPARKETSRLASAILPLQQRATRDLWHPTAVPCPPGHPSLTERDL